MWRLLPCQAGLWILSLLTLTGCLAETGEPDHQQLLAQKFYKQNQTQDLTAFDGISVRMTRPVLKNDATVLGYVYEISFCTEVVDVQGQRGAQGLTFYYSDWPDTEYQLERRGYEPQQLQQLAELFEVPEAQAKRAFVEWAEGTIGQFNLLHLPRAFDPPPTYVQELRACVSKDGHSVRFRLAAGIEVVHLADDTDDSLYWLREKKALRRLGPGWYWRPGRPQSLPVDQAVM